MRVNKASIIQRTSRSIEWKSVAELGDVIEQLGVHIKFLPGNDLCHRQIALHVVVRLIDHLPLYLGNEFSLLGDQLSLLLDTSEMLVKQILLSQDLFFLVLLRAVVHHVIIILSCLGLLTATAVRVLLLLELRYWGMRLLTHCSSCGHGGWCLLCQGRR